MRHFEYCVESRKFKWLRVGDELYEIICTWRSAEFHGVLDFVMVIKSFCLPAQIEAPAWPSVQIEAPARLWNFYQILEWFVS